MLDRLTNEEVEAHARWFWEMWESMDPEKIVEVYTGGHGFGYRTRAPREPYGEKSDYRGLVEGWLASMDHVTYKMDELHTMACEYFGVAWGLYHEIFREAGKTDDVELHGRFSLVFTREDGVWSLAFYHRDMTPYDRDGNFIPPMTK